jgi:hypothetical protein
MRQRHTRRMDIRPFRQVEAIDEHRHDLAR